MAKLFKIFGKKNPSARGEYMGRSGLQYEYRYGSGSLSDLTSDNAQMQAASGLSSFSNAGGLSSHQQYHRNTSGPGQGECQTSERYRHHSTEDDGAGLTDDFEFRGAGALNLVTNANGNRKISDGGNGAEAGVNIRRNEMGEPRSPVSKKPIVIDDYSDPKDVLKAVQESGMVIPPEKPEVGHPYPPEDDYSVPYEAQKMIRMMRQSEDQKKGEGKHRDDGKVSRYSDDHESWTVPTPQERFKHHTYEEPPNVSPPIRRPDSPESYVGESSDEINGHSPPLSTSPSPHRQPYGRDHHSSSPMSSESAEDYPPTHSTQNHRQQTPQHDRRPTAEYDNPWEWSTSNLKMAKIGPGPDGLLDSPRARSRSELPTTSRLMRTSPESDTRPGDEYDQPWEWAPPLNRKFSQAITEKEKHHAGRVSPLPDTPSKGNKKNMKLDIKTRPLETHGEFVDATIQLKSQSWYHGKLSRSDAEKKLKSCREGSYLVRQSESAARDYSLSLKSAKGFMHMKIVYKEEGFILGEFSKPFPSIMDMIGYYTHHKLNIRGAEHMALLYPVKDQLL
ncbi:uncharacterized protein [Diadema antillarum]|uniref:uncharacterized protein n=1 Tax=Diadema antillarum TaxID=105358 RepID=UPI003A8C4573